ncbi:MAG: SCP2 sterol-binding domain-containing protein [Magnetococcales bacterium]|nr:SCP2 sterol-binding domain-containing protein [Magnetococcales bacterium]MBF0323373.1 SCP2 sterol-binding domain-containing protein [Magnetococcales bacterium]
MLLSLLPNPLQWLPSSATAIGLGITINLFFLRYPDLQERLRQLEGKIFRFEVEDLQQEYFMEVAEDGRVRIHTYADQDPHVTMSGSSKAFLSLLFNVADPDSLFFSRELNMSGETDTGLHFKNILNNVEIDWEKELAAFVTTPVAGVLSRLARQAHASGNRARDGAGAIVEQWLEEEQVLRQREMATVRDDVTTLEKQVERLDKRLIRLSHRVALHTGSSPSTGS